MATAHESRKRALDEHDAAIDALHQKLREHTAPEHHERLQHAIEKVKASTKAIRDDDAFGSPGEVIGG